MEVTQIVSVLCLIPLAALIFGIPELGLVLCLVVGSLFKGMIQPFLGPLDITVYLFAITFSSIFIRSSMEKKLALPDLKINIGILLLTTLLLVSLLYTPLPRQGTEMFLRFVFLTISMLYATFIWCNDVSRIKRLLFIFSGILLAYGTAAFIWVFLLGHGLHPGSRSPFPETPVLGIARYLAVGIAIAFILRSFVSSKYKRLMLGLLMIIGLVELIALNARGPLIALFVGILCLFLLYSPNERRRLVSLAPIGLAIIVLAFILLPSQYTGRYVLITNLESSSITWRLEAWQYVIAHFSDWFFTGAGICGFHYYYLGVTNSFDMIQAPHNIFLGIFADVGFFGLLLLVWLIGSLFYRGAKMPRAGERSIHLLGLATIVAFIVFITEYLFGGSLISTRGLWFFGGLILSLERLCIVRDKRSMAPC